MFHSDRPKFSLNLTIKELSNIPQIKGSCYVDIQIRESPGMKSFPTFKHKTVQHKDSNMSSSSVSSTTESQTSVSSKLISVHTSNKHIHNYKCAFNYNLRCNLRFPLNKKENLIGNKYLMMRIYYVDDSHDSSLGHGSSTTELGRLELNLSEYLNFDEPTTSKYLLQNSKINSILTLVVYLEELPADYDFHTQLQITDNASPTTSSRTSTQINRKPTKKKLFNVPQFETNKVFSGFNGVLGTQTNGKASTKSSVLESSSVADSDNEEKQERSNRKKNLLRGDVHNAELLKEVRSKGGETSVANKGTFMMDPTISNLYKRILESTWDPELHKLLEFDPEMCIQDIFHNNGEGWNKYISENFGTWEGGEHEGDEAYYTINGLIDEPKYRDELKSWNVNLEKLLSK